MMIEWFDYKKHQPIDRHDRLVIAKSFLTNPDAYSEIYIVSGAVMQRYYDEFILEHHHWTEYTKEKWEYLNK